MRTTRWAAVVVAALGLVVLVAGVVQARDDAPTFDEPVYVTAGLLALQQHDLSYNAEHPPLAKAAAALPVALSGTTLPPGHASGVNDERDYSAVFVRAQTSSGELARTTFLSRVVPLLELLAVAVLLAMLGRVLLGPAAGLLAAALWLVSPMTLGLGHLDGIDLPFALAVVVHSGALLHARRHRDLRSAALLGVGLGLCLATSLLGAVLVPVTLGVLLVQRRRAGLVPVLVVLGAAWATLWASYAVLDPALLLHPTWLLPAPYVGGFSTLADVTGPTASYLLGQAWTGWQWFFVPGSVLVKVTTPVLLALVVGPFLWRLAPRDTRRDAFAVLLLPAGVLALPFLASPRDLGIRYLLPTFALWCVGASPLVLALRRLSVRVVAGVAAAVAVVMLAVSLPHPLAYTVPPFVPGYRVATDSNLDWGQDLGLLQQWAPGKAPYVDYFGPRGTSYADVPGARDLLDADLSTLTGWVAVSATHLTADQRDRLSWLRAYCPVGTLGGTVLLYRFAAPPSTAPGPVAPALPCAGGLSTR